MRKLTAYFLARTPTDWFSVLYGYTCPYARRAYRLMPPNDLTRMVNISSKYRFVYMSNPKTGCSSIKSACIELELRGEESHLDCRDLRVCHDPALSPMGRLSQVHSLSPFKKLIADGYRFVTFVRNPYQRLVSFYMNQVIGGMGLKSEVLSAMGYSVSDMERPISFAEFVETVVQQSSMAMNRHWRPQTDQILFGVLPYEFIGKFENFAVDYYRLFAAVGIPSDDIPAIRQLNESNRSRGPSLEQLFDTSLQDKVYNRYRLDFENFGYPYELPS